MFLAINGFAVDFTRAVPAGQHNHHNRGVTNVTLKNFIFIPRYGMYAAAWTTIGAFSISVLTNGIFALFIDHKWKKTEVITTA